MSAYHSVMLVAAGIAFLAALVSLNRKSYAHPSDLTQEMERPAPKKEPN
jgi:hypothetical protein